MTRKPERYSSAQGQGFDPGDLPYLMELVRLTREPGQWQEMQNYWRYRCDAGAIYNWWPSTGNFNFQGPADEKKRFSLKFLLAAWEHGRRVEEAIESGTSTSSFHMPIWSDEEDN